MKKILNKSGFTLMELMVSIAILTIITSTLFNILAGLFSEGEKGKEQLELRSEIVGMVEVLRNHIKNGEEIKIVKSKVNKRNFNGLLIKNANGKYKDSLFTIIKPLEAEFSERELPTFPGEKNYFLGITDDNLFVDIEYSEDFGVIISDPGNGNIWQVKDGGTPNVLLGGNSSDLFTPTGLYLGENNLYISDTYANKIYYISRVNLAKNSTNERNFELKLLAGSGSGNTMGFNDGNLKTSKLNKPKGLTIANGTLYIVDSGNNAVRSIKLGENEIETYIGNGKKGMSEDDGFHESFLLNNPTDIEFDKRNEMILLSDTNNNRIISFGPREGSNAFGKPYTIAGLGMKNKEIQGNFGELIKSINGLKINNPSEYEEILNKKEAGKSGFSGDYSLANTAQLHHPTGIKSLGQNMFVFSDSGNNIIREVITYDFGQCTKTNSSSGEKEDKTNCEIKLKDGNNIIKTVIGNATEIELGKLNGNKVYKNLKAPTGANYEGEIGKPKTARLNIPMGIGYGSGSLYFADNLISTGSDLFGKLNTASGGNISFSGSILSFNEDLEIKPLDIDKVNVGKIEDFISTSPINLLFFENKTNTNYSNDDININKSQSLIKLYLRAVSYLKNGEPLETEIETSISPRKIIPKY